MTEIRRNPIIRRIEGLGDRVIQQLEYIGGVWGLLWAAVLATAAGLMPGGARFGAQAFYAQLLRVGVRSIGIIVLISAAIGAILALQMAPPLQDFGQVDKVANIISIAILRELGPLISAVVLTGFAGASIAAELGTMVVGEEIEALESMALDPVRFLVVPRVLATVIGLIVLAVFADIVAICAGMVVGVTILEVPLMVYWENTVTQASFIDLYTGLIKAGVFGMLIGIIACYNGLKVSGGASGVGLATTITVVHSIVSIVIADLLFTTIFYAWDLT